MRAMRERSGRRFARLGVIALCSAVALGVPAAAEAAGPNSQTQPLADGCQRNPTGLLTGTSPEWVYVNRDPSADLAEGIARSTHTASGDLPEGHDWYDLNTNLDVDPAYSNLLATGNFAGNGEETGRLHMEWETGSVPRWVWPTEADRLKVWGSWAWDCGHWGQSFRDPDFFLPGSGETPFSTNVPGERTEFHPMQALVVTRANPYRPSASESEADVYISTDGTLAHAQEQCAFEHPPPAGNVTYGPDYTACWTDPAKRYQPVNDRDYKFFVPAPPAPPGGGTLTYDVVDMAGGNGPQEQVQILPDQSGINVTVPFKHFGRDGQRLTYGKSFFLRWVPNPGSAGATPPTHVVVKLASLQVIHSLDPNPDHPTSTGVPPAEWNLYLDANGDWEYLNDWVPGLGSVVDGQQFDIGRRVDLYVPAGGGVRVFTHGRECDLPKINPCPDTAEVADDNDIPGDAIDTFPSVNAALGKHVLRPASGNYELTYFVSLAK